MVRLRIAPGRFIIPARRIAPAASYCLCDGPGGFVPAILPGAMCGHSHATESKWDGNANGAQGKEKIGGAAQARTVDLVRVKHTL